MQKIREAHCTNCGFDAPDGDDAWDRVEVPSLGTLTRCPECGSSAVVTGR